MSGTHITGKLPMRIISRGTPTETSISADEWRTLALTSFAVNIVMVVVFACLLGGG